MNNLCLLVHMCTPGNFLAYDLTRGDRRLGLGGNWNHSKGWEWVSAFCEITGATLVEVVTCPACEKRQASPQASPRNKAHSSRVVCADDAPL